MFKTTDATTQDEYIDRLDEPRRSEVRQLHELIRSTAPELQPMRARKLIIAFWWLVTTGEPPVGVRLRAAA